MKTSSGLPGIRLFLLALVLTGATVAIVIRLAHLQVYRSGEYRDRAKEEHLSKSVIPAARGVIKDRNGRPLALTVPAFDVTLDTSKLQGQVPVPKIAQDVGAVLNLSPEILRERIEAGTHGPTILAAGADASAGKALSQLSLPGLKLVPTIKREYPEGNIASTLLGFIGVDKIGLTGLEADFQGELGGVPGVLYFERDSVGDPIPLGYRMETPSRPGGDVTLTLDRYTQKVAEEELEAAIKAHKADGGTAIVMDPRTGEVLAMASKPSFSLEKLDILDRGNAELYRNRAITDLYEPGSTFKAVTMAAALNEGLVQPDTTYFDGGPVVKYGRVINTWNGAHFGTQTMTSLLVTSNNVGSVWVSDLLGPERFYDYVRRFGFGQPTNVGLSGEAAGQLRTYKGEGWTPIDLNTNSFGQGISVTPLQMIAAYSAIANGGTLMRPFVVKKIETAAGRREVRPVEVRRVITPEASEKLMGMLHQAAERGSPPSRVKGFKVAGKTGTADIPSASGYTTGGTIGSFIGFVPYPEPKAAILVKIDNPKDTPWGSVVSSPVFSSIARRLLINWKVPPAELALAAAKAN